MDNRISIFAALGLGAGLMYLFDPVSTGRRRALVRDKVVRGMHEVGGSLDVTSRDLLNRSRGLFAETKGKFFPRVVSDDILVERVRAKLGRYVSHPHAIDVTADDGFVSLRGLVLAEELEHLLSSISSVNGVKGIRNSLVARDRSENVPSLQGGKHRYGERMDLLQAHWSPTTRFFVGLFGVVTLAAGWRERKRAMSAVERLRSAA